MKRISILIFLLISTSMVFAQGTFDQQLALISQNISTKLSDSGKSILVANFTDLQGNETELGRFLSEALSVELINTSLTVVDRSGKDAMMRELGYMDSLITLPDARRKFGQQYGVDYLVKGSMTLLDNTVDINIKVLDIYKGVLVAGMRSQLPRTDAINNLLRNNLNNNGGAQPANQNVGRTIDTHNKSPLDDLFNARMSDLRRGECVRMFFGDTCFYGQLCFENQTGEDLIFYSEDFNPAERLDDFKVTLPNGSKNCSRLIVANFSNDSRKFDGAYSKQVSFVFYTMDGNKRTRQSFVVDRCRVKSFILTKKNLVLLNTRR